MISTFAIPALLVLSVILDLNLNGLEFVMLSPASSLQYCHKLADIFALLLLYSNKLYIGITISRFSTLSTSALFILPMQLRNGV